jgi:hypothetical protein
MAMIKWVATSRGRCLGVGTIEAEDDRDALRRVTDGTVKLPFDVKPEEVYTFKAGGCVMSSHGDEVAKVVGSSGWGSQEDSAAVRAEEDRARTSRAMDAMGVGEKLRSGVIQAEESYGTDVGPDFISDKMFPQVPGSPPLDLTYKPNDRGGKRTVDMTQHGQVKIGGPGIPPGTQIRERLSINGQEFIVTSVNSDGTVNVVMNPYQAPSSLDPLLEQHRELDMWRARRERCRKGIHDAIQAMPDGTMRCHDCGWQSAVTRLTTDAMRRSELVAKLARELSLFTHESVTFADMIFDRLLGHHWSKLIDVEGRVDPSGRTFKVSARHADGKITGLHIPVDQIRGI